MRIISGINKGIKLFESFDKNTRPLKDLVKESIFNILEHSKDNKIIFNNSKVLDLFSGTGSFGLEFISRGASKVYFVENYKPSIEILNKNINKLKCKNKISVFEDDVNNFADINQITKNKFDIIFIDPPYKEKNIGLIIEKIIITKILNKNGRIILHRHKKSIDKLDNKFLLKRTENYGISKIIFGKII